MDNVQNLSLILIQIEFGDANQYPASKCPANPNYPSECKELRCEGRGTV